MAVRAADRTPGQDRHKWAAFGAIAISFVTMVISVTMVFVALSEIADDFGVTLRAVSWVVVAQALTISALMMPMGRLADIVGWKRIHLIGLALFAIGAIFTALAPTFGLLIMARVVMSVGNAMGQAVGTAMVVSVFPPNERGMAIGSQTSAVAIGGVSGPIVGGFLLELLPWQMLFLLLVIPIAIAFVAGYLILDEARMRQRPHDDARPPFDWGGAILSALAISSLVITINNPLGLSWASPIQLLAVVVVPLLSVAFVRWELHCGSPMLDLRLFSDRVFSLAILTRTLGFMATTATFLMMPVYLISFRDMGAGAAGGVLVLTSLGMGLSAQVAGRLTDRFGPRRFTIAGLGLVLVTSVPMALFGEHTSILAVMAVLLAGGIGAGLFNVPNNTMILGAAPASALGVVAALTNLARNIGDVFGQAIASGVIVAVMVARGFDVPLDEVGDNPAAGEAFVAGWRIAFVLVAGYAAAALLLTTRIRARSILGVAVS